MVDGEAIMNLFDPGDLVLMSIFEPEPVVVTILSKISHPYLNFRAAYKVLDSKGRTHSVSEIFLKSIP